MAELVFPSSPIAGQLFPDPAIAGVSQWVWGDDRWNLVAGGSRVTVSTSPPGNPSIGDLWFDADAGGLYVWFHDGTTGQWVCVGGGGGGGGASVEIGTTPPGSPANGDLWWDQVDGSLSIWTGSEWVCIGGGGGGGGSKVEVGATPPSGATAGTLWWNSDNGQLAIWTGDVWVQTNCSAGGGAGDGGAALPDGGAEYDYLGKASATDGDVEWKVVGARPGTQVTVVGAGAMPNFPAYSTAVGHQALRNTTSTQNTAVGATAGAGIATGGVNTVVGYAAMSHANAAASSSSVAVGASALLRGGGEGNVAIGSSALGGAQIAATTQFNICIGRMSGNAMAGSYNIGIGTDTYRQMSQATATGNIAIGDQTGWYFGAAGTSAITGMSTSVLIGHQARPLQNSQTNTIVIGANALSGGSNTITLGNDAITALRCNVQTITALSDPRLKEDIEPANLEICLNAVKALPVTRYRWKDTAGGHRDKHVTGWLPDDVAKVFPKAVTSQDEQFCDGVVVEDCKSITMSEALPTLWGAVQRLIAKNEELERRLAALTRDGETKQ